jgi:hypothetical protein
MKNKINLSSICTRLAVVFALCTILAACGKTNTPSATINGFLKEIKAENYEKAIEYFDPAILEQPGAKEKLTMLMKEGFSKDPIVTYKILDEEIDGNEAKVLVAATLESGEKEEDHFDVVLVDGSWYLSMN